MRLEVSTTTGRISGAHGAIFGHADLEVGEQFEQEGFEWLVGAVEFVDQQHRRRLVGIDGGEQRAGLQELTGVDVAGELVAVGLAGGFGETDRHELTGVVPLVSRGGEVHAVIALQPDQAAAEAGGEHLGDLGLAGAGLALQEQRPLHGKREMHRRGQFAVGDIAVLGEQAGGFRNRTGKRGQGHLRRMNVKRGKVDVCAPRAQVNPSAPPYTERSEQGSDDQEENEDP